MLHYDSLQRKKREQSVKLVVVSTGVRVERALSQKMSTGVVSKNVSANRRRKSYTRHRSLMHPHIHPFQHQLTHTYLHIHKYRNLNSTLHTPQCLNPRLIPPDP